MPENSPKSKTDIDLGRMVRSYLTAHGIKVSWLAEKLSTDRSNCYKILKRKNMDIQLLIRISQIVGHNFVADVAKGIE